MTKRTYTFIDLFAGIGGFHQAMHSVGVRCMFASGWDKNARLSYEAKYKDIEPKLFKKNKKGEYPYFYEHTDDASPTKIHIFDIFHEYFLGHPVYMTGHKHSFKIYEDAFLRCRCMNTKKYRLS